MEHNINLTLTRCLSSAVAACFFAAASGARAQLPLNYNVTDLTQIVRDAYGPFFGNLELLSVNDQGQILGVYGASTFLISGGSLTEIGWIGSGRPGATPFRGYGLNNLGEIVGSTQIGNGSAVQTVPAILRSGVVSPLDSGLGQGFAAAISDNGYVAGGGMGGGFLYRDGSVTNFPAVSEITGVNSSGRVVGNQGLLGFVSDGSSVIYPVRPQDDDDLGNGNFSSRFSGVNDAGQIAVTINRAIGSECNDGPSCETVVSREVAVLDKGNLQYLSMPEASEYWAQGGRLTGINNRGVVIGVVERSASGVIYEPLGDSDKSYSQYAFFPQADPRLFRFAPTDISDSGRLIGKNAQGRWLLLDPAGTSADLPLLPAEASVNLAGQRVFTFAVMAPSEPGQQPIFFDPPVAVGYEYAIQSGPSFASVLLPDIGDGKYRLELWDGSAWVDAGFELTAGETFDLLSQVSPNGLRQLRITGIETSAALDPDDPNAFVTGFAFTYGGELKLTQTSLTVDVPAIPEPATYALMLVGLCALAAVGQRRRRTA